MALIKCPECGRENVSSTAESCPNCGFGIKAHFDKLEQQRIDKLFQKQKEEIQNARKAEAEIKYMEYSGEVKRQQSEIDNINEPQKPHFFKLLFDKHWALLTCLIMLGPMLVFLFCYTAGVDSFILVLYIALGVLASPIYLIILIAEFRAELSIYKKELKLFNTDRKEWQRQKEQKKADIETRYRQQAKYDIERKYNPPAPNTNTIKCPMCGNTDIEKITTMDRSFSIAMVGMASGKIGKQYKCKKCKHMW